MKSATFHLGFLHFSARKVCSSKLTRADKNLHFPAYSSLFSSNPENDHTTNAYFCIVERHDSEFLKLTLKKYYQVTSNNRAQNFIQKTKNFVRMNAYEYILLACIVKLLQ